MAYDIDGVFVGADGEAEVNAGLRLQSDAVTVTTACGERVTTIPAPSISARKHIDRVARELLRAAKVQQWRADQEAKRAAKRAETPRAVPKPRK